MEVIEDIGIIPLLLRNCPATYIYRLVCLSIFGSSCNTKFTFDEDLTTFDEIAGLPLSLITRTLVLGLDNG